MVRAAIVLSNVHPAESERYVLARIDKESTNAFKPTEVLENILYEKIGAVRSIKVDCSDSLVIGFDDNGGKSLSVRQCRGKNSDIVEIVVFLDYITEVPYLLWKV